MIAGVTLYTALWLWLAAGAVVSFYPAFKHYWWAAGLFLLIVSVIDLVWARRSSHLQVERQTGSAFALGVWAKVKLVITNEGGRGLVLDVYDHHPQAFEAHNERRSFRVGAGESARMTYRVRPLIRGDFRFEPCQLRVRSPLGFWRISLRRGDVHEAKVYPNFAAVAKYALLAVDNHLSLIGVRKRRRRGEGMDFHQLREYREGDSLRQIDWKASARSHKLISKEYQDERDQQLIFLVDCGRRMRSIDGDLAHFDHALNSVLLLSYVALRQGDAVGVMSFAGDQRWLPPVKGAHALNRMLNGLYDLQPTARTADYSEVATRLMAQHNKRALVVIISNVRDEDSPDLVAAVRLLRRRHLVMVASLREHIIDQTLEAPVQGFGDALRSAATHHYQIERQRAHDQLVAEDVSLLNVLPEQLPLNLVNRYLDIKRSGRL